MTVHIACLMLDDAFVLTERWATAVDRKAVATTRSLATRAALRALLARVTGRCDWTIRPDVDGKPFVSADMPGPAVSMSHSGDMVAVAVGMPGSALGIDIEKQKPRNFLAIADHWFGPAETAAVAAEGAAAFYRVWTAREALGKALGVGLTGALGVGDIVGAGADDGAWIQDGFCFYHLRPVVGYSMTVATNILPPPVVDFTSI